MTFEYRTIWPSDNFRPFEYQTSPVCRSHCMHILVPSILLNYETLELWASKSPFFEWFCYSKAHLFGSSLLIFSKSLIFTQMGINSHSHIPMDLLNTMGAWIPNMFGFWMLQSCLVGEWLGLFWTPSCILMYWFCFRMVSSIVYVIGPLCLVELYTLCPSTCVLLIEILATINLYYIAVVLTISKPNHFDNNL